MNKGRLVNIKLRPTHRDVPNYSVFGSARYRKGEMCPTCRPECEWNKRQTMINSTWRRECCGAVVEE